MVIVYRRSELVRVGNPNHLRREMLSTEYHVVGILTSLAIVVGDGALAVEAEFAGWVPFPFPDEELPTDEVGALDNLGCGRSV